MAEVYLVFDTKVKEFMVEVHDKGTQQTMMKFSPAEYRGLEFCVKLKKEQIIALIKILAANL